MGNSLRTVDGRAVNELDDVGAGVQTFIRHGYVDLQLTGNLVDLEALPCGKSQIVGGHGQRLVAGCELARGAFRRQSEHHHGTADGTVVLIFDPHDRVFPGPLVNVDRGSFALQYLDVQFGGDRYRRLGGRRNLCESDVGSGQEKNSREYPDGKMSISAFKALFHFILLKYMCPAESRPLPRAIRSPHSFITA